MKHIKCGFPATLKLCVFSLLALFVSLVQASSEELNFALLEKKEDLKSGYIDVWYDSSKDKTYLKVARTLGDFIYQTSLPHGLGSNDVGLDRGQLGHTRLVSLQPSGNKVLLIQENTEYRATSDNPVEVKAIQDSFANAIIWQFPLVDENQTHWLLDASEFLLRDTHEVADRLKQTKQGSFKLDVSRSSVDAASYKSFPLNTELEARLTFTGSEPGEYVRQVAIDAKNVSLRIRHSFVALPEPGYQPLQYHPQSGYFAYSFQDYGKPVNESLTQQWIPRHRLAKKDPGSAMSDAVKPIVYYLDAGVPEPVKTALLDGARWWAAAFEAIGYKNAYQVKVLPEDADPMDVRYNIIQWVHRATRGWSYGASIIDPRTGEIIKGHVSLGSLRIRQDYLIAQAMLSPFAGEATEDSQLQNLAINRIKQLSAHEVGHTLGLAHNFAASAYGRASVMDYPHPLFELRGGTIHAENAYTDSLGIWDKRAIAYAYTDFGSRDAALLRAAMLQENQQKGYWFISDADSRDISDAHPLASLWDNGDNAVEELNRVIRLRAQALKRFGEASLRVNRAYSDLEEILIPLYYFHRYQTIAAGKYIGGYQYHYAIKGQGQPGNLPASAEQQEKAIEALLKTLSPDFLNISDAAAALILPKVHSSYRSRESNDGAMGVVFDRFALAQKAVQHTLNILLDDARLMRLSQQGAVDGKIPAVPELLVAIHKSLFDKLYTGIKAEIQVQSLSLINSNYLNKLHSAKTPQVLKEQYFVALQQIQQSLQQLQGRQDISKALKRHIEFELYRLPKAIHSDSWQPAALPVMPPGSPI
ncbi:zinc-dependent metalloprotease [Planctobacterium marinum]|uniref:zinc-dependent metalloprotease n=1 Tax=Planctobacterium marinum TaxID=1631968 RepID=UPI001E3EEE1F|nr:zinc-dependent metalloprotease [Planctobacterium marinum]MCC2605469.1 zinc-dependent metalloprotease [Planctobacterium marinum]